MATDIREDDFNPPASGTEAALRYYQSAFKTFTFLDFVVDTAHALDETRRQIKKWADELSLAREARLPERDPGPNAPPGESAGEPRPVRMRFLAENSQLMMQMFLARFVDNFQTYLVEVIRGVLAKQPRLLASSEPSLSTEYVVRFLTMEEMVADLIEAKVNGLSYRGIEALRDWCTERGVPLTITAADLPKLAEVIDTRNVIAHNRGLVDRRYVRNVPSTAFKLGSLRELDPHEVNGAFGLLNRVVRETDRAVVAKFDLPAVSIQPLGVKAETGAKTPETPRPDVPK